MINDIIKATTIIFVVEGISYLAGKKEHAFTPEIVQLLIYIIVGIIFINGLAFFHKPLFRYLL